MNTAEKAKAYDEALGRAKSLFGNSPIGSERAKICSIIFPELAESDDERIRKAIIELLKEVGRDDTGISENAKCMIAYLEKQKESPKSTDSIPTDCTLDAKCEDRWHKLADSLPDNGREVLAKDTLGNLLLARYDGEGWNVSVYDDEDYRCHNGVSKWCEIPPEKQKECLADNSKTSASEDEKIRKWIFDLVNNMSFENLTASERAKNEKWKKKILAYLEKQKVNTEGDFGRGYDCGYEACLHSHGAEWFEKQKEHLPIPDKFSGLKSLMLQYLQSAANRKDDTEIESDTDLWGRKILDYVWKYSDEQK